MKLKSRILAVILVTLMCISITATNSTAAEKDIPEISAQLTGLEALGTQPLNAVLDATEDEIPAAYNSAERGYVLPVRTQQDNICWAFGTLSTMETLLLRNQKNIETLSPQHANIWAVKRSDGTGWQRNEGNSGYSYIPLGYLTSGAGPVYDSLFPIHYSVKEYKELSLRPDYLLTEAIFFNNESSADSIKALILEYGSVAGNFNANGNYASNGDSYYCADHSFKTSELNGHCISVVGWDDNYPKEKFSQSLSGTPLEDGAWIIKNSWGENNGDRGYYYISYEDVWMFDQKFGPSYALSDFMNFGSNNRIYQNEIDGATYECTYFTSKSNPYDTITYINAFNFEEDNRTLDKVVFETTSKGADYTVYYIPVSDSVPTDDQSQWTELSVGTVDHTGYICVDIEDVDLPQGEGAIGISLNNMRTYLENKDTPGYKYIHNSIGVSEWLTSGGRLIFMPQAEYGMSFYMQNGKIRDLMDYYEKDLDDSIGGTFVIKAITTATEEETTAPPTEAPSSAAPSTPAPSSVAPSSAAPSTPAPSSVAPSSSTPLPTPSTSFPEIVDPLIYMVGDADMNEIINIKDATLIQKHTAELVKLEGGSLMAADADRNLNVNVKDATLIQKFIAEIEIESEIGKTIYYFE